MSDRTQRTTEIGKELCAIWGIDPERVLAVKMQAGQVPSFKLSVLPEGMVPSLYERYLRKNIGRSTIWVKGSDI